MTGRLFRLMVRQMDVQLRVRTFNLFSLLLLIIQPAIFSAVGIILSKSGGNSRPDLIYFIVGGGMLGMWSGMVFSSTFDINRDRRDGTLELIVASPTPLSTVEGIRTLTNVMSGLVSMLTAFSVAVLIYHYPLAEVNVWAALVSLALILFAMWSIGIFLANFPIWSRLQGSYVEYFELPVALVCGFMYPIRILPGWMQAISACIPIRWALEGLDEALLGNQDVTFFLIHWGAALVLSVLFWRLAHWLDGKVHDRIRVTGEMSSI